MSGTLRLEHFDARRVWCTYSGQLWGTTDAEKARAIRDARQFYNAYPHVWIGGVRLIDMGGRIVWSIAAAPTFRLEIAKGDDWEELPWSEHRALSRDEAERGRDHNAAIHGGPVRIVLEEYPRESAPVDLIQLPTFSAPEIQTAYPRIGRSASPPIFQYGERSTA
ncbi:hypothetical protein [Streptomyces anulatus]|uniref:hypothetical protein n=1 Tax=Streptomyces anulatus TaxID=1892 RepID=UPI003445D8C5